MAPLNIVIMAGGGGTRLWPLSRQRNPKQFLDLGTGKTLLEHTYDRARTVAEPADIFVATAGEYVSRIHSLLPQVASGHIFTEPARRDTAAAFAAAAVQLKLNGRADLPTTFMWSDHVFTAETNFLADLKKIPSLVQSYPDYVIILGHVPTSPETTLGYLEVAEKMKGDDDVFLVKAFKEKPDLATAQQYLDAGTYFWNMAYISCTPTYLLEQLREHEPELMHGIDAYAQALQSGDHGRAERTYAELPKISIDYALLEKTPRLLAVTGDYGWTDVGNWGTVKEIFGVNGDHVPRGHHIHVDSQNNYIYNATSRAVSIVGLTNTIVVVTDDAVLVTDTDHAAKVKDVVRKLEEAGRTEYL